jgi:hypothetical protein
MALLLGNVFILANGRPDGKVPQGWNFRGRRALIEGRRPP